jgi:transitional endoplasmic reticulum ATPase
MPEILLRVEPSYPVDVGGGKIRIDPETMRHLRVSPGDIVAIEGTRTTVARVWRLMVEDFNRRIARLDHFTCSNAGVSIGSTVKISGVTCVIEAQRVVLDPPENLPEIPLANIPNIINGLIAFPVTKNDAIPVMPGLPNIQPQTVTFRLAEIAPENAILITEHTKIIISNHPLTAVPDNNTHPAYDKILEDIRADLKKNL